MLCTNHAAAAASGRRAAAFRAAPAPPRRTSRLVVRASGSPLEGLINSLTVGECCSWHACVVAVHMHHAAATHCHCPAAAALKNSPLNEVHWGQAAALHARDSSRLGCNPPIAASERRVQRCCVPAAPQRAACAHLCCCEHLLFAGQEGTGARAGGPVRPRRHARAHRRPYPRQQGWAAGRSPLAAAVHNVLAHPVCCECACSAAELHSRARLDCSGRVQLERLPFLQKCQGALPIS